jgi:hypothetical protein
MFAIKGLLRVKGDVQQVKDTFKKREFVLTDNSSQYPQHISFQLTQDKCALLDNVNVGEEINVSFNLRGREWTSPQGELRYFNSLEAWRIEKSGAAQGAGAPPVAEAPPAYAAPAPEPYVSSSEPDDLPF